MTEYYVSYSNGSYCVIEKTMKTKNVVFSGSIEDCNRKCIELNQERRNAK